MSRSMIIVFIIGSVLLLCGLAIYAGVTFSIIRDRERTLRGKIHNEQRRLWDIPGSNSIVLQLEDECDALIEDQIHMTWLLTGTLGGMAVLASLMCLLSVK